MSNSIDFSQMDQAGIIFPAGRPTIFIDGQVCGLLLVERIVRASYPEFGWAEVVYNAVGMEADQTIYPEAIEDIIPMGSKITICQYYNRGAGAARLTRYILFSGYIEEINTNITEGRCEVRLKARDLSAKLERLKVSGRRVSSDDSTVFVGDNKIVFNYKDTGNRSLKKINHCGRSFHVFCGDSDRSCSFSYSDAIQYLLSEYILHGLAELPESKHIESIIGDIAISNVDVNGLNLIAAINKCCQQIGMKFKFSPRQSEAGPDIVVVFFKPEYGRCVELNRQHDGEVFSISRTNVHKFSSKRQCWPITQRYIGFGDMKEFEATFEFIRAWDSAGEGFSQSSYATASGNFEQVEDVYRKWCLNEVGDYSNAPFNAGQSFDFSTIFETESYVKRRRRFLDCITSDTEGNSLGEYLEISYDSGATWQEFVGKFDVLADECGVWISDETLDNDLWAAEQVGKLRFRITAMVESDERLSYSVADGPINSSVEVVDNFVSLPSEYSFRKVTGRSIFHKSNSINIGIPDEADDSEKLASHLIRQANATPNIIEHIEVTTPMVNCNFEPGDRVMSSPESRDILGVRSDGRSLFWIERVEMDFEKQCTKLKIVRQRNRTV